jgi:hypothetical protein
MLNYPLHYHLMHAMAHAFPRQVCTASVPHHKKGGRNKPRHRADLRKQQKIYDYILSSPQENGNTKNKKSSALPVVTLPTAQQQQITKNTAHNLILTPSALHTMFNISFSIHQFDQAFDN